MTVILCGHRSRADAAIEPCGAKQRDVDDSNFNRDQQTRDATRAVSDSAGSRARQRDRPVDAQPANNHNPVPIRLAIVNPVCRFLIGFVLLVEARPGGSVLGTLLQRYRS